MNFKEYIKTRKVTDNTRGAFIKYAQSDLSMADNFKSWRELQDYLQARDVGDEEMAAAKIVWGQYRSYLSDNVS